MRPRKLRHRPSDELIDIRERGLPWLFSVFVVLFLLLTILLFYFIFTTRDVYLSQKQALEEEDVKLKEAASLVKEESEEVEESWKEQLARRKGKGGGNNKQDEKVHVDIVPIVNRKTGEPDKTSDLISTTTTTTTTVRPAEAESGEEEEEAPSPTTTTTTTTTEEPITTTTTPTTTTPLTTSALTTTEEPTTTTPPTTTTSPITTTTTTTSTTTTTTKAPTTTSTPTTTTTAPPTTTTPDEYIDSEEEQESTTISSRELESDEKTDILLELEDDLGDVQVEEYEETTMTPTTTGRPTTTTMMPLITTERPTTEAPFVESNAESVVARLTKNPDASGTPEKSKSTAEVKDPAVGTTRATELKPERNFARIIWDRRPVRSTSEKFKKFAIVTHHEECSKIGKEIYNAGGNSVDATVASEICISALHPHSTGPGFGAVMLVHSKKKNGTFLIDGRERAPKNANQNTFSINPTNAHIGYSSMGVPGWISTLWTAYKQFGSGKVTWKSLIEPTLELLENNRIRVDRILGQAFESRKNHVLHEKSFGSFLNATTREGVILRNLEYEQFLKELKESVHAEHDFYGGHFSKSIVDEMKSRGGLISRHDLEGYNCIVTRAETLNIGEYFVAGPHLPYHFPILKKVFQNISDNSYNSNPENLLEYYVDFVELLQKANRMRAFVGDDLFEPEVKHKIDDWVIPKDFKPEEQAEQNQQKRKQVPFSRILSTDEEGNAVNFMSTNTVPWGSVRRSSSLGFVWNNAMSSFDVFCRHDTNCVRGGKRPSVTNGFPTILLNGDREPELLISPTSNSLEATAAIVLQATLMNMRPQSSLDHPRLYPHDQVFVETGVPEQLYRTLWTDFRAQFTHPTSPVTLIHRDSSEVETLCDYRQSTRICYPSGT
ncbi:hypothetical protein CAEBREN_24823 [Caenorhabditis brenneri]|uniref:Gamma-glutamyltransferase n=1 Tax=Caenorhabditis brenneri TaxID=135651 RepID=G0PDH5_CAEBE|nr:hypothetical protein CAEBREN_24823 [Caenorhabditis brenneri]